MIFKYDVIVVGGGHAGCEAASAAARAGSTTLLITQDIYRIAQMSCNPAVGGIAKGQIVREIDALGGYMGIVADKTSIQFRMLNKSKGPALWSPRTQNDMLLYNQEWRKIIENHINLYLWQDTVNELIINNKTVTGVKTALQIEFHAQAVVLTTGTFLNGLMHFGSTKLSGGRFAEPSSYGLTEQLVSFGIKSARMKTGTPPRIDKRSIDFSKLIQQDGDKDFHSFSFIDKDLRTLPQLPCYILHTNTECHNIIKKNIKLSPLYNGQILSIGPRYCPSIETKIHTFADKDSHQLFLEPIGSNTNELYLNGFSSSLPFHIQLQALNTIEAFKNLHIIKPGYAIEYDFFDPTQLHHTLESKIIKRLFMAGQINGTTGYEEAAGQGLIAGVNAHLSYNSTNENFVLKRNEAYIGVLIDDLVTKGVDEPYRMFTSRAEYRMLLRQDNADMRLTNIADKYSLINSHRRSIFQTKLDKINVLLSFLTTTNIKPNDINPFLRSINSSEVQQATKLVEIIKRPNISIIDISKFSNELSVVIDSWECAKKIKNEIIEEAEILIKYQGYIKREELEAQKLLRLENKSLKIGLIYNDIQSLSIEARQKLTKICPRTIAQATRIPGVSPSDINVLLLMTER